MEKETLPRYSAVDEVAKPRRSKIAKSRRHKTQRQKVLRLLVLVGISYLLYIYWRLESRDELVSTRTRHLLSTDRLLVDYDTCSKLRNVPHDPSSRRERSARYVDGHKAVLVRNATVWTGEPAAGTSLADARSGKGYSWIHADVLMEHGLIKRVESGITEDDLPSDCEIYEAKGRPLTSGIVDMHSHAGVDTLPALRGSSDDNELSNDITPYVRSIDGLNPLDHQIQNIKSGGVTTSLILPGSGNNMGGEAYVIKHAVGKPDGRLEISAEDMLADPQRQWRYMKMACGENAKRVYGRVGRDFGPFSRLGEAWYFRHAFEEASVLVNAQNDWCNAADELGAENMASYLPQDLQWESLGALLRGQVLLNVHCYTAPDLEAFVRHTNEFNFSVRAFHHAHQTYLLPEILKRAYGDRPPAAALFADNMYYKAEAYVASEQAGKILWDNGITPVYVSDNPVINAQHVVFEAAKAYKNGLSYHVALAGVTSASAELLGLAQRIGKVKAGFDADVVVWDSDPLAVGATPVQVWIDGTPQFEHPVELQKTSSKPLVPQIDLQTAKDNVTNIQDIVLSGVSRVIIPGLEQNLGPRGDSNVIVRNSTIVCAGECKDELSTAQADKIETLHLRDGHIVPALTAFGSSLGLVEIAGELDTQDGFNGDSSFSRAVDGLALDTKNLAAAYSHGVTDAISAPLFRYGGFKGVSAGFAANALTSEDKDAVFADETALHYTLTSTDSVPTLSGAVGELRPKLIEALHTNETSVDRFTEREYLRRAVVGDLPLAITVHSADLIASLLRMKAEIESIKADSMLAGTAVNMIIVGGAESWMLADALFAANIGVVLAPMLPYSASWDQRRSATGAPLWNFTAIDVLHEAGVKVAIGTQEDWETRDLFLSAGIAYANGGGKINETEALAFVSSNIYDMLRITRPKNHALRQFVVSDGNPLEIDSRIRGIADGRGELTVYN